MLSVIIPTLNSEKPLAYTLSALVPAVVDGLLRRVVVIDGGSTDATPLVAEGAGCALYGEAEAGAALAGISTPWVLLLRPGAIPREGWEDAARRHMEGGKGAARFSAPGDRKPGILRKIFTAPSSLDAGLLARLDAVRPLLAEGLAFDALPARLKPSLLPHEIALP